MSNDLISCACGVIDIISGTTCEIGGVKHRTDGPCYHCDEYGNKVDDDPINPSHYRGYQGLEVIDLVEQMNFNRGNAVKYIARAGRKSVATEKQDLQKALWYIEREIVRLDKQQNV